MKLRELLEQRAKTVEALRAIVDNPAQHGDLSPEQQKKFDELKGLVATYDKSIERQRFIDEADRRIQGEQLTETTDHRLEDELRQFSLLKALAMQVPDLASNIDCGRERELSAELARRAGRQPQGVMIPMQIFEKRVTTTTTPEGGPGSNLISTDHWGNQFIDLLRNALRVRQLGARVLNGLVGNVDIPRLKGSTTAGWVAENAPLAFSDLSFGKLSLTPKHCGSITELSRNVLLQTSPDVEALVRADFASVLAEAIERVAIQGGGANEPVGILETPGIHIIEAGPNGGWVNFDLIADLIGAVEEANGDGSSMGFLSNSKVKAAVSKLKSADAWPFGLSLVFQGMRAAFSNAVPSNLTKGTGTNLSPLLYADWSELLIGYWSVFDLLVNPYETTAYRKGNVQVRAMLTADVAVRHPEAFAAIIDLET